MNSPYEAHIPIYVPKAVGASCMIHPSCHSAAPSPSSCRWVHKSQHLSHPSPWNQQSFSTQQASHHLSKKIMQLLKKHIYMQVCYITLKIIWNTEKHRLPHIQSLDEGCEVFSHGVLVPRFAQQKICVSLVYQAALISCTKMKMSIPRFLQSASQCCLVSEENLFAGWSHQLLVFLAALKQRRGEKKIRTK